MIAPKGDVSSKTWRQVCERSDDVESIFTQAKLSLKMAEEVAYKKCDLFEKIVTCYNHQRCWVTTTQRRLFIISNSDEWHSNLENITGILEQKMEMFWNSVKMDMGNVIKMDNVIKSSCEC